MTDATNGRSSGSSGSLIPEFISALSHDLRSPLNTITGYSEILLDGLSGELNDVQQDYAIRINRASDRMSQYVNDIIDVSRIELGLVECHLKEFNLTETVRDAVEAFNASTIDDSVNVLFDGGVETLIESDSERVLQCVDILLQYASVVGAGESILIDLEPHHSSVNIRFSVGPVNSIVMKKHALSQCHIIVCQLLGGEFVVDESGAVHRFCISLARSPVIIQESEEEELIQL